MIQCDTKSCNKARWNPNFGPTEMNLENPPRADTVLVHPGQFVVIRFFADNPGD